MTGKLKEEMVIILSEAKFDWRKSDVEKIKRMLNSGMTSGKVAEDLKIKSLDMMLMILHLENEGELH